MSVIVIESEQSRAQEREEATDSLTANVIWEADPNVPTHSVGQSGRGVRVMVTLSPLLQGVVVAAAAAVNRRVWISLAMTCPHRHDCRAHVVIPTYRHVIFDGHHHRHRDHPPFHHPHWIPWQAGHARSLSACAQARPFRRQPPREVEVGWLRRRRCCYLMRLVPAYPLCPLRPQIFPSCRHRPVAALPRYQGRCSRLDRSRGRRQPLH